MINTITQQIKTEKERRTRIIHKITSETSISSRYLTSLLMYLSWQLLTWTTEDGIIAVIALPALIASQALGDEVRRFILQFVNVSEAQIQHYINRLANAHARGEHERVSQLGRCTTHLFKRFELPGTLADFTLGNPIKPVELILGDDYIPAERLEKIEISINHDGDPFTCSIREIRNNPILNELFNEYRNAHWLSLRIGNTFKHVMLTSYQSLIVGCTFWLTNRGVSFAINKFLTINFLKIKPDSPLTIKRNNTNLLKLRYALPYTNMALLALNVTLSLPLFQSAYNNLEDILFLETGLNDSSSNLSSVGKDMLAHWLSSFIFSPQMLLLGPTLLFHILQICQSIYQRHIRKDKAILGLDNLNCIFKPLLDNPIMILNGKYMIEATSENTRNMILSILIENNILPTNIGEFLEIDTVIYAQTILDNKACISNALQKEIEKQSASNKPQQPNRTQRFSALFSDVRHPFGSSHNTRLKAQPCHAEAPSTEILEDSTPPIQISFGEQNGVELKYDSNDIANSTIVPVTGTPQPLTRFVFIPPECDTHHQDLVAVFRHNVLHQDTGEPSVKLVGKTGAGLKKLKEHNRYSLKIKHTVHGNARLFESARLTYEDQTCHVMGHVRPNGHANKSISNLPPLTTNEIQRHRLGY